MKMFSYLGAFTLVTKQREAAKIWLVDDNLLKVLSFNRSQTSRAVA